MSEFTPTQGRYLAFIKSYMEGFGLAPAESEMATAMKVSPPSVNQMMRMLEKKGFVRRKPGVARSIEILIPLDSIPNWKGKKITRTVRVWTQMPTPLSSRFSKTENANAYRFKITLEQTNPAIWREIETTNVSLADLHALIQTAMGWANSHMHLTAYPASELVRLKTSGVFPGSWISSPPSRTRHTNSTKISWNGTGHSIPINLTPWPRPNACEKDFRNGKEKSNSENN